MTQEAQRKKRPRNPAQRAKLAIDGGPREVEDREPAPKEQGKDPAAASLGGRGGVKGGEAKYSAHTPEQRRELARLAANHRWAAKKGD